MKWEQFQIGLLNDNRADTALLMYNRLSVISGCHPDNCVVTNEEIGGKLYTVCTTPRQRKLFWEQRIENWITPKQVDPAGAFQKRLALEKELGILAVLPLDGNSLATPGDLGDLRGLLLNCSPLIMTRAVQLLSTELDQRGRPEIELVALVTADYLTTDEIRRWESACEELVQDEEEAA